MLKEDGGTFEGGFGGLFVFSVKDPAETTVAKIGDNGLDDTRDGAADCAATISADGLSDGGDGLADLFEDAFDYASSGKIGSDGSKAAFYDLFSGTDDVIGELVFGNSLGHHGDLAGL